VKEADLQRGVIERAQQLRWKVMHPLPGQTKKGWATATQGDGKGYPDLTLVRERIIFVELKAAAKYLTREQKLWRDWLLAAGAEWYMWKPLQWFDGTIDSILGVHLPVVAAVPPPEITDTDKFERLLNACMGDEAQARRVYAVLTPERETAPPQ
jgi:hypothetical protein